MKPKILAALALLCALLPTAAIAQLANAPFAFGPSQATTAGATLVAAPPSNPTSNWASCTFDSTGTWSGTVNFTVTPGLAPGQAVNGLTPSGTSPVTSTTTNSVLTFTVSNGQKITATTAAGFSGSIVWEFHCSSAPAPGGGGGSSGGAVTVTSGSITSTNANFPTCQHFSITSSGATTVHSGAAILCGIMNASTSAQAAGECDIYDNTSASGTIIYPENGIGAGQVISFVENGGMVMTTGITINCANAPSGSLQVLWRAQP